MVRFPFPLPSQRRRPVRSSRGDWSNAFFRLGLILLVAAIAFPAYAQGKALTLDDFDQAGAWTVVTSDQVSGKLRAAEGHDGRALCLDYDFNGVSGYAAMQRELPLDYPGNYAFAFQLRGDSPANDLQFKLVDDSGDNVWWVNRTHYQYPTQWTQVVYKKRHITRAWGPAPIRPFATAAGSSSRSTTASAEKARCASTSCRCARCRRRIIRH